MKILIVNRFFGGAQIPTGRMAEDVARVLVESGHEVTALASTGTYAGAEKRGGNKSRVTGGECKEAAHSAGSDTELKHRTTASPKNRSTLRVETVRVPKWMPRALAWVWFAWQARKRIPRMDWDVCVLMTDPPLLPLLTARMKAADGLRDYGTTGPRDATRRVAVWLMDLYPEALVASGRTATNNPIYRWYFSKRQQSLAAADLLICLGQAQKELLDTGRIRQTANSIRKEEGEGGGKNGVSVGRYFGRAVGTETLKHRNTEPPRPPLTQRVRTAVVPPWDDRGNIALATEGSLKNLALYAGNLGEAHCFEEILAAAPFLPGDWTIRFAVRGAKLAALKAAASGIRHTAESIRSEAEGTRDESGSGSGVNSGSLKLTDLKLKTAGAVVHVSGYASEEETPRLLASARVHLITMSPGWEGIVVPSKLYGCVRTGRPVLFIGPENADTAREIRAHDWGKVLPPGASGEDVAAAILELAARPTRATQLQRGAAEVAGELIQLAEGDR
ncbi:MAG: hypothetical protein ACKPBV_13135 [Sphaerospermopsis kisseleviana]